MVEDLTRVVAAWRKKRAPELAAAAIAIGAQVDAAKPPLSKARQKVWLELAKAKQPEDLGRLLATLFESTAPLVKARLEAISKWPDDPRTSATLAAYVGAPQWDRIGPAWRVIYQQAIAQLVALADPASAAPLVTLVGLRDDLTEDRKDFKDLTEEQIANCVSLGRLGRTAQQQLEAAASKLAKLPRPKLTAAEKKVLPRAKAPTTGTGRSHGDGAALLAEIYANPADDGVRLAYADWLQEHGDPRGELIVLQCQRKPGEKPSPRERKLLSTYERTWLGEIAPVLLRRGVRFERGFLAAASYTNAGVKPFIGHPSWATVEELELSRDSSNSSSVSLLQHAAMRSLRTVRSMRSGVLAELLASKEALSIETIEVHNVEPFDEMPLAKHGLPRLKRLEIGFVRPELVAKLLDSKLGKQLVELVAGIGYVEPDEVEAVVQAVKQLRGLALTSLQLTHTKGARWSFAINGKTWTPLTTPAKRRGAGRSRRS